MVPRSGSGAGTGDVFFFKFVFEYQVVLDFESLIIICPPRYASTNIPSERGNLLRALGETRDVFVIQKYLDMTLNQVEQSMKSKYGKK